MCIYLASHVFRKSQPSLPVPLRIPVTLPEAPTVQREPRGDSEDCLSSLDKHRNINEVTEEQESMNQPVKGEAVGEDRKSMVHHGVQLFMKIQIDKVTRDMLDVGCEVWLHVYLMKSA